MPIYEYKCLDCGSQFEKMQKVSDLPLTVCEKCSGKLEKQWSLSGFQFKGEGWYVSEYGKKIHPTETKSAETQSTETATGEKTSTTEPTTKTETSASKETVTTTATSKTE
jgi:putative FmdB family regulatory protein